MVKKERQEKDILMTADGRFLFGRILKNGGLSADTVPIGDDVILKLIAAYFEQHCSRENTDTLVIENPLGVIVLKQVTVEDAKEAVRKTLMKGSIRVRGRKKVKEKS